MPDIQSGFVFICHWSRQGGDFLESSQVHGVCIVTFSILEFWEWVSADGLSVVIQWLLFPKQVAVFKKHMIK